MFNLGLWEIFILAAVALIVVGPEKLPKLARDAARFINDIKRTTSSLTQEMSKAMDEDNFQKSNLDKKEEDQSLGEQVKNENPLDDTENEPEEFICEDELSAEELTDDLKNTTEDKFDV